MVWRRRATLVVLMGVCAVASWGCGRASTPLIQPARVLHDDGGSPATAIPAAQCAATSDLPGSPSSTPAPEPPRESVSEPAPESASEPLSQAALEPTPAPLPPPVMQSVYLEVEADGALEVGLVDPAR